MTKPKKEKKSKKEKKIKKEKLDTSQTEEDWLDKVRQLNNGWKIRIHSYFDYHNLLFLKNNNKNNLNNKCWVIIKFVDKTMYKVFIHNTILLFNLNW